MNLFRLLLAVAVLLFVGCSKQNVRNVVSQVAEQQVDTTGYSRKNLSVSPFSHVDIDCMADITFSSDSSHRVELLAPQEVLANITAKVEKGVLELSMKRHYRLPDNVIPVVRIHAPAVQRFSLYGCKCLRLGNIDSPSPMQLDLVGVGTIQAESLKTPSLELSLDGAGHICLDSIRTNNVKATLNGAGDISLSGTTQDVDIKLNGAGNVDIQSLQSTRKRSISMKGAGNVNQ